MRRTREKFAERAPQALMCAALLFTLCVTSPVTAQEKSWGQARGWSLGLQIVSDHIGAEDPGPGSSPTDIFVDETGGGIAFHAGYAFNPMFGLRFSVAGARHETTLDGVELDHGSVTLEAHFRFLHGARAQPYLYGGLGGSALEFNSEDLDSRISGGVAVFGGGVLYHLTRHLSLDIAARLDLINWDKVEVNLRLPGGAEVGLEDPVDEDGSAGKLLFGLLWSF